MKILHVSNVFGEKSGGGIHEAVDNISFIQSKLGHEVHVWHLGGEAFSKDHNDNRTFVKLNRLKLIFLLFYAGYKFKRDIQAFDVIHQHGVFTSASFLVRRVRLCGLNYIIQPHGLLDPFRMTKSYFIKSLFFKIIEQDNLSRAAALIVCSELERKSIQSCFGLERVFIAKNGVRSVFLGPLRKIDKSIRPRKTLLFLSQLIPVKGLDRLFEVIKDLEESLKDWDLIIAGNNNSPYAVSLQQKAKELKCKVEFVGAVFGKEKLKLYDTADCFILPSFNENFGIVVIEALSRELPVLTTQGTPWGELQDRNCGFWVKNTNQGIKEGLQELIATDYKGRLRMGMNGRKLVLEQYNWEVSVQDLLKVYKNTI